MTDKFTSLLLIVVSSFVFWVLWNLGPIGTAGCAVIDSTEQQVMTLCGYPDSSDRRGDVSFFRYTWRTSFTARAVCFKNGKVVKADDSQMIEYANPEDYCGWSSL